jgi:hypothetical protein
MTLFLAPLFYYMWGAPRVLQIIIVAVLLQKRLAARFPIFTTFTVFSLCKFVALFLVRQSLTNQVEYFNWYSVMLGVYTVLRFAMVIELFSHVFARHAAVRNFRTPLFHWTAVALIVVALSFAAFAHPSYSDTAWFQVHLLERSANLVLCGLLLSLFLFSACLRLKWSRIDFGIGLGLGVLCSLELALAALRSQIGHSSQLTLDLLDMANYQICVLIWLAYLLLPERYRTQSTEKLPDADLESWNHELQQLLRQ